MASIIAVPCPLSSAVLPPRTLTAFLTFAPEHPVSITAMAPFKLISGRSDTLENASSPVFTEDRSATSGTGDTSVSTVWVSAVWVSVVSGAGASVAGASVTGTSVFSEEMVNAFTFTSRDCTLS